MAQPEDAFTVLEDPVDIIGGDGAGVEGIMAVSNHLAPVVANQPTPGAKPQETHLVLDDTLDHVGDLATGQFKYLEMGVEIWNNTRNF